NVCEVCAYKQQALKEKQQLEIEEKAPPRTLTGHTQAVRSLAVSLDGTMIATGSNDTTIKLWDVARGVPIRTLIGHTQPVISLAFTPDGSGLVSASWDKTIKFWDPATGQLLGSSPASVKLLSFSPDGRTLAAVGDDATIKLLNVASGKPQLRTLTPD